MDFTELARIVEAEGLDQPVLYGEGDRRNDSVMLERDADGWRVFLSNERGGMVQSTLEVFDSESDALDDVLFKLRQLLRAKSAKSTYKPTYVAQAGGSLISRHALDGDAPIRWAFREESLDPVDNGWRFLSAIDDEDYINDPSNLAVVDFNTVVDIEPAVLPLLPLPIGTDVTIDREPDGRITLIDNTSGTALEL